MLIWFIWTGGQKTVEQGKKEGVVLPRTATSTHDFCVTETQTSRDSGRRHVMVSLTPHACQTQVAPCRQPGTENTIDWFEN